MDFVNSLDIHEQRLCRNHAFVIFYMAHSLDLWVFYRLKMPYKARKKNKWKFYTTRRKVKHRVRIYVVKRRWELGEGVHF
jgi:hypothetical protein